MTTRNQLKPNPTLSSAALLCALLMVPGIALACPGGHHGESSEPELYEEVPRGTSINRSGEELILIEEEGDTLILEVEEEEFEATDLVEPALLIPATLLDFLGLLMEEEDELTDDLVAERRYAEPRQGAKDERRSWAETSGTEGWTRRDARGRGLRYSARPAVHRRWPTRRPRSIQLASFGRPSDYLLDELVVPPQKPQLDSRRFAKVLGALEDEAFSDGKLEVIRDTAERANLTVSQAIRLVEKLAFSDDRVEALALLYPSIIDTENFIEVYELLHFSSDRSDLRKRIRKLEV